MLKFIKDEALEVFPNLEIVLKMYLCTAVANCTGQRSLSKKFYIVNTNFNSLKMLYINLTSKYLDNIYKI